MSTITETTKVVVTDLKEGDWIDASPLVEEFFDTVHDEIDFMAAEEHYFIVGEVEETEPINGIPAVILYTGDGSWNLPVDYLVERVTDEYKRSVGE